jgi:hypothetical protein
MNAITEIASQASQDVTAVERRILLLTANAFVHSVSAHVEDAHAFAQQRLQRFRESGGWLLSLAPGLRLRNPETTPELIAVVGDPHALLTSVLQQYRDKYPITPEDPGTIPPTKKGRHAWIWPAMPGAYLR